MTNIRRITVWGRVTKCAHRCRYCLQGEQSQPALQWEDYTKAVEKYAKWSKPNGMAVSFELASNYDLTIDRYKWYLEMTKECGKLSESLLMGGMKMRNEAEMFDWLAQRKELGLKKVIFSMSGTAQFHDDMNRRKGDLEYLLGAQRAAFALGLNVEQRIFITKENLGSIEELCSDLDNIGKPQRRSVYPLHFRGNAMELENIRIDENDVKQIPASVMQYMMPEELLSERQWADRLASCDEKNPENIGMFIYFEPENINSILSKDCGEVFESRAEAFKAEYVKLPSLAELCERYADRNSRKVYEGRNKVAGLWFERYTQDPKNGITPYVSELLHAFYPMEKVSKFEQTR